MFMNVSCPTCGHKCRVPESSLGQQVRCPACSNLFECGTLSPPSLAARPVPPELPTTVRTTPSARPVQPQPDQGIHYRCPRCHKPLESPAHMSGQKVNCPDCAQRLQIPKRSVPHVAMPSAGLSAEKPVPVADLHVPGSPPPSSPLPVPEQGAIDRVIVIEPRQPPAASRPEHCLECGVDVTRRQRVQTCPDCGSTFCSARCYREHRYHAHPPCR